MAQSAIDSLPSWDDGAAKNAILEFVRPEELIGSSMAGKPVAINTYIGRRPIACFGNSDGDHEMLMRTTVRRPDGHPSLGVIVHHTPTPQEILCWPTFSLATGG